MFCEKCGKLVSNNQKECPGCGESLEYLFTSSAPINRDTRTDDEKELINAKINSIFNIRGMLTTIILGLFSPVFLMVVILTIKAQRDPGLGSLVLFIFALSLCISCAIVNSVFIIKTKTNPGYIKVTETHVVWTIGGINNPTNDVMLDDIVTVSNPPLLMSLRNGRRVRLLLKDASAVADCIRQQKNLSAKEQKAMNSMPAPITPIIQTEDVAEQLKKFKQLENEGIITQEEFEIKKKQLLNL